MVTESTRILEYIDEHLGSKGQLYPSFGDEKVRNFVKVRKYEMNAISSFIV